MAEGLKHDPPVIVYRDTLTSLVMIDGEPKVKKDDKLGMERVMNSPFPIVKNTDGKYYLHINSKWFTAASVTASWSYVPKPPKSITNLEKKLPESNDSVTVDGAIPLIIVATKPTELIQSSGKAKFNNIEGTSLLYMNNSDDDIFMDVNSQNYFVLISGRWYKSAKLEGPWTFTEADKLPEDFKKIPKGSDKDNVLVSVAGTEEAKDAIAEAQIPQTAKVDRKDATTKVTYDGSPKFEAIEGTDLSYAVNTSSTVLKSGAKYYVVDNGVWFESTSPNGPWTAATSRPTDVEKIPASNPTYNVKYVYVYDVTPEYIYMGYTPGYLGCFVFGPTIVFGTGWYYPGWYGAVYYPRPVTFGFSMHYNPWVGWSVGFGMYGGGFYGGYWGPPMYFPPYRPPYGHYYGGRPVVVHHHHTNININNSNTINHHRTNNVYNHRNDVATRDRQRPSAGQQPAGAGQRPATTPANRPSTVQSDRNGNVYQRDNSGQWQQRENNSWKSTENRDMNSVNRSQQSYDRGASRSGGFDQMNRGGNMGGGMRGGMGGGGMGGGRRR
jgi:hypothetical protein